MDFSTFVNLYIEFDKKNTEDNKYVMFNINTIDKNMNAGLFFDESDIIWLYNKDATIFFITNDCNCIKVSIDIRDNILKYSNFITTDHTHIKNNNHKENFLKAIKDGYFNNNIRKLSVVFKNGLNKDEILPFIKLFVVFMSLCDKKKLICIR